MRERCLRETLAALTGDREPGTRTRHERLAATVACKAAIKAGDELSPGEMRALFIALARHDASRARRARPRTIVQLSWDEDRAALWPHAEPLRVICGPTGAGKSGARNGARAHAATSRSSARTRARSIAASTSAPRSRRRDEQRAACRTAASTCVEPTERYSAARVGGVGATRGSTEARAERARPLVVGGAGLYLRALFEPLFDEPPLDPVRRAALETMLASYSDAPSCGAGVRGSIQRARISGARSSSAPSRSRCSPARRSRRGMHARPARLDCAARYLVVDPGAGARRAHRCATRDDARDGLGARGRSS